MLSLSADKSTLRVRYDNNMRKYRFYKADNFQVDSGQVVVSKLQPGADGLITVH